MSTKNSIIFGPRNYQLMIAGVVVIFIGFILMSTDKNPYGFGPMGLTVGPLLLLIGLAIQFAAIFYKDKSKTVVTSAGTDTAEAAPIVPKITPVIPKKR